MQTLEDRGRVYFGWSEGSMHEEEEWYVTQIGV